jgi:hypothetical protein
MGKVAIFGCGPAGLLVAHAAQLCGHAVTIYSKKQKSPMEGAQYLHVEIPGFKLPEPEVIRYVLFGSIETYREKVYGSGDPDIIVSPQQYLGEHKCWDLRALYARLWLHWEPSIVDIEISKAKIPTIAAGFDWVFSSIPATVLCEHYVGETEESSHTFKYQPVWIDGLWSGPTPAEDRGLWGRSQHVVICNGFAVDEERPNMTGWYRSSHIFGHANTEWASPRFVPDQRAQSGRIWRVRKPMTTNCDCWPYIVRVGRYGKWAKGVLTHHAFDDAMALMS